MISSNEEFAFSRPLTNSTTSRRQPSTSRQGGPGGNHNEHGGRSENREGEWTTDGLGSRRRGVGTSDPPPTYSSSQHQYFSRSGASGGGGGGGSSSNSRRGPSAGNRPQMNGDEWSLYEQSNGYRSRGIIDSDQGRRRDRETSTSRSRHESNTTNPRSGAGNSRLTTGYSNDVNGYGRGTIDEGLGYHIDGRIGDGYNDEYGATDALGRPRFNYHSQSGSTRNNGGQYGGASSRRDNIDARPSTASRGSSGLTTGYGSGLAHHTRGGTNGYGGTPRMAYYPPSSSSSS